MMNVQPVRVLMRSPFCKLQIAIVWSSDPDAKYSPFGENDILLIKLECPVNRTRDYTF